MEKTKQFFRRDPLVSIVLLVLIFFASQILAGLVISLYPAVQSWTQAQSLQWLRESLAAQFGYIVLVEIITIASVLRILKWTNARTSRIGLVPPRLVDAGWALVTYGLYFLAFILIRAITSWLLGDVIDVNQPQRTGFESAYGTGELLMTFIALVILPPIAEEILFRGFLYSSLRSKYTYRLSVIVTSLIFCVVHLQFGSGRPLLWMAAIDTFVLSCFLCGLREKFNTLWPSIFMHAIKNGLAFFVLFGDRFIR